MDIAVTNGKWKLPKHILLCTTLRHLYRSKLLTTILNRLGQCESYDVGLELETAFLKAIGEVSTKLTPQIILGDGNEVYHMEWDNLNVLTTSIHGSSVVNSTGGIMIKEIKPGADVDNMIPKRCLPLYKRNNTRSLKLEESHNLLPVHTHTHIYNLYMIAVVLILLKMISLFHPQRMMRCSLNVLSNVKKRFKN